MSQTAVRPVAATAGQQFSAQGPSAPKPSRRPVRALRNFTQTSAAQSPAPEAAASGIALLASVQTPSPAESFALNGSKAYICDDNDITVVDITNPLNLSRGVTISSPLFQNSADIHCSLQRNTLVVFADQSSVTSQTPDNPGFVAFSLSNPAVPQLVGNPVPINKSFFGNPAYIGNYAFVPTFALHFFGPTWDGQFGDLLAVNVTNFASPAVVGTLAQPQVDAKYGGTTAVIDAIQADSSLVYVGGSTATGPSNSGVGRLQAIDVSNPAAMQTVAQLRIPGTVQFSAPLIQGTLGVGIGNDGGWVGAFGASPASKGNIVVVTFDVTDRRTPTISAIVPTGYTVGQGGGSAIIGSGLFAFAGALDIYGNQVLLVVDATNPKSPVVQPYPTGQAFTSMQVVGNTLYATLGSAGFAAYSIPGTSAGSLACPTSIDAVLVFDQGTAASATGIADAKAALKSFIDSLRLTPDQVGLVSVSAAAGTLNQPLTTSGAVTKTAVDSLRTGGASYLGAGIAAAQAELTGPRHKSTASPVILLYSDGGDKAGPSGATTQAANAAKAAGIRIIAVQPGTSATALMQSIASSNTDFYLLGQ